MMEPWLEPPDPFCDQSDIDKKRDEIIADRKASPECKRLLHMLNLAIQDGDPETIWEYRQDLAHFLYPNDEDCMEAIAQERE